MDNVAGEDHEYGVTIGGIQVNNLRFADDIDLIQEDRKSLQAQVDRIRGAGGRVGLLMNVPKTKTMVFGDRQIDQEIQVAGKSIENVEKFDYLGSLLT